ncbi:MAG: hypothetical protein R3C45_02170 [Phycisphaerales bacterium]
MPVTADDEYDAAEAKWLGAVDGGPYMHFEIVKKDELQSGVRSRADRPGVLSPADTTTA